MTGPTHLTTIPMQIIRGCLVASVQVELTEDLLMEFQQELLERIGTSHVQAVVLDVSGVKVMDSLDFEVLRDTMTMASIMGATPIIVGIRPGIVSALIDMDVDVSRVRAALNVDDALNMLGTKRRSGNR